jgi:hypothetical protein
LRFIEAADKYFDVNSGIKDSKIFKIMRKITFNLSKEKAPPISHVIEIIQVVYSRKV